MNHTLLLHKITSIAALSRYNGNTGRQFAEALEQLSDWHLNRINPLRFASESHLDRAAALEYFVLGVKVGLFDFIWNTVCPWCGSISGQCHRFDQVTTEPFFCLFCHARLPRTMDVEVETAFTLNPEIKDVRIDPFSNLKSYWRFFFSPNARVPRPLREYLNEILREFTALAPDETADIVLPWKAGEQYRLISLDRHSTVFFDIEADGPSGPIEIDLLPGGFSSEHATLGPEGALRVRNLGDDICGCVVVLNDEDTFHDILLHNPVKPIPYLTGKMLLNNQTFREVFRMDSLRPDLKLDIRSLVLLFTDLKGSTAMYDTRGDAVAYELIQEHFVELTEAVRNHAGAIVKTMGDAVMASFSTAKQAVAAAIEMLERMERLNQRLDLDDGSLGLKVGLHQGPTLAVHANDTLDYFGQTVNVAARVQGLANAGEIWFTEPLRVAVRRAPKGYRAKKHIVRLRGVDQDTIVFQMTPTGQRTP